MNTIYHYPSCSTCKRALKWLKANDIVLEVKDITKETPSKAELVQIISNSKLEVKKFFNTAGKVYKERRLKDVVNSLSIDEAAELLASEGMLIKRPLVVTDQLVIIGFKEDDFKQLMKEELWTKKD